jgi:cytochrome c
MRGRDHQIAKLFSDAHPDSSVPLWGDDSFNDDANMSWPISTANFMHRNIQNVQALTIGDLASGPVRWPSRLCAIP